MFGVLHNLLMLIFPQGARGILTPPFSVALFYVALFLLTRRAGSSTLSANMSMIVSIVSGVAVVVLVLRTGLLCLVRPVSLTVEAGVAA